jgi:hypothetical protein
MSKVRGRTRGWIGWALGALAALTLVIGAPEHVLDLDEAAGPVAEAPVAEVIVHGHASTVMDHSQPGHSCAAHCAAHTMGGSPAILALEPPVDRRLAFALAQDRPAPHPSPALLDRPPKA